MTERLDLFPCPFCGVLPTLGVDPKDGLVYPFCDCIGADAEGSFVSVDIWQDRPAENALRAELAQARAELAELKDLIIEADACYLVKGQPPEDIDTAKLALVSMCAHGASALCEVSALSSDLAALRERTRWVKVSERLPEKRDAAYLCVMDAYTDHTPYISVRFFRLTGEWNDNHVTHWQPLPEPPEANDGG